MTNQRLMYVFLILLIAAICFSPRFSVGYVPLTQRSIDIRAEDIILFFGLFFSVISFLVQGKNSFTTPPLFWPIFSWVVFGFFSVLVNVLLYRINVGVFFFYFLKELEFFILYFLVFSCSYAAKENIRLIKYWIIGYVVNTFWLGYVLLNNVTWSKYYGPNTFTEPKGPFPSGGFFLMIFIFLFNLSIFYFSNLKIARYKKIIIFILCFLPAIGVFSSGSYTATVGLIISLIISFISYFIYKASLINFLKALLIFLLIFIIAFGLISILEKDRISKSKLLWEYGSSDPVSRIGILKENISRIFSASFINLYIGFGIWGEAHSQYARIFLERGLFGLIIFGWLIFSILKLSYNGIKDKNNLYKKGLSMGLFSATLSMLVMFIPNDVLMPVKPAEVYWFFAALAAAAIVRSSSEQQDKLSVHPPS